MHIKGEIRTQEELRVDGEVEGMLESQSVLSVGETGKVRANIKAQEVSIYGSVRGNVEVSGKIAIREQGSLVGDIKAAGISIDDGAYFKGSIDIVRPEPKAAMKPAVVKSEPKETPKVARKSGSTGPPGALSDRPPGLSSAMAGRAGRPLYSSTIPRWSAATTACVRSLTFKRLRMMFTCHLTVPSVIPRAPAISLLLIPLKINRRISISRVLSSPPGGRSARLFIRRAAGSGGPRERCESPGAILVRHPLQQISLGAGS